MDYTALRKDLIILKIGAFRNRINILQLALTTYRTMKNILSYNKEQIKIEKVSDIDTKIDDAINSINLCLKILSSLESELFKLEGDDAEISN